MYWEVKYYCDNVHVKIKVGLKVTGKKGKKGKYYMRKHGQKDKC